MQGVRRAQEPAVDQRDVNEREWHAPGNWRWGWLGVYSSEQDSRLVVPKRNRIMGWTLNFAHPGARFLFGLLLAAALLAALTGRRS
jgi:uncharacterized membrane protein